MKAKIIKICLIVMLALLAMQAKGQTTNDSLFSLKDCILLSFANNCKLKQTQLETKKSLYKLKETVGAGLPKVVAMASLDDYFDIPVSMVSGEILGQSGTMVPIQLGTKYNANIGVQVGQMIYDASYFASIQLFKKACEISDLNIEQNKEDLAYNIAYLYFFVQVSALQVALLDSNIVALKKVYGYSEQHYKSGLILKTDLDRVSVAINNLESERDNLLLKHDQQLNMMKYIIGVGQNQQLCLYRNIGTLDLPLTNKDITFKNQVEVKLLENRKELANINMKMTKAVAIPSLSGYAGYSNQAPVEEIRSIGSKENWYTTSYVGVKLTVPIFEGNRVRNKVQQCNIELEQIKAQQLDLQSELDERLKSALQKLNANSMLESKLKVNMDLADRIFKVINEQYHTGLKSFTDVLNAQSEYNTAHLLWLNSLLEKELSKLNIMKTSGTINLLFI